jgi:hypothetical protein
MRFTFLVHREHTSIDEVHVADRARRFGSGRDGGSRTRTASRYELEPGTARIAAMSPP